MSRRIGGKSVLNYIGKKDLDIIGDIGKFGIDRYCEPFAGSFNTGFGLMSKGFSGEVILNDINSDVISFWECLRDEVRNLYNRINEIMFNMNSLECMDDKRNTLYMQLSSNGYIDKCAAFYVLRECISMASLDFDNLRIRYSFNEFESLSNYLKEIKIHKLDYKDILKMYDSESTYFFIDPPYNINRANIYYGVNSVFFYHRQLSELLNQIKSKFLLTYNNDSYIMLLYQNMYTRSVHRRMFRGVDYSELYLANYDISNIGDKYDIAHYKGIYNPVEDESDAVEDILDELGINTLQTDSVDIDGFN